ncbi:unnamed protein product [Cunninghamella blakesleeana]
MPAVQLEPWKDIALAIEELQLLMTEHLKMKLEGTLSEDVLDSEKGQELLDVIDTIKDLHTQTYSLTRDSKQETAEAKDKMDEEHVGLQNVMYEKRHIVEEIVKCCEFRSVYQNVDLIPLDEFLNRAPEQYLEDKDNLHTLMVNRLKFEHEERTSMKLEEEKLQAERKMLIKENRKAQEKLDRFDKLLDDFVLATVPIDEALEEDKKSVIVVSDTMDIDDENNNSQIETKDADIPQQTQQDLIDNDVQMAE